MATISDLHSPRRAIRINYSASVDEQYHLFGNEDEDDREFLTSEFYPARQRYQYSTSASESQSDSEPSRTSPRHGTGALDLRYLTIHEVRCESSRHHRNHPDAALFFDHPRLNAGDCKASPLHGKFPLKPPLDQYLKEHPDIIFVVLKHRPGPLADPLSESIRSSRPFQSTMKNLVAHDPATFSGWDQSYNLEAPYVHLYPARAVMRALSSDVTALDDVGRAHISVLLEYLNNAFGDDYEEADDQFKRGVVTLKQLPKLFRANDIVACIQDGQPRGTPRPNASPTAAICISSLPPGRSTVVALFAEPWSSCTLGAYPVGYDKSGLREKLLARGATLWSCRSRRFISYTPPIRTFEVRTTYKHIHGDDAEADNTGQAREVELDEELMNMAILQPTLGYLLVDHIQEIKWNKAAFDRLVLDPDKKSLITAMVNEHVLSDVSADVIEGKGNGLIILLHGGPGTGKTLTAESVAELAEKPLYRVTCGDIGTDAEAVEKYLESVLYIGTIWKAVVLFDESDVFLEERSQADLQRNALVSVLLRVLEYYDGILILTSNRVGTFDEAFKSRVQLALHYPAIDEADRMEIWLEFVQDLQRQGGADVVEYDQLHSKIGIRNAIRTARQLASQAKRPLAYDHLKKAIKVAQDFEQYVVETHGGVTDEAFAKGQSIRLS
ncbi:AAA family ATPase [Apodospora peruviana]|uniref:AAA family ATPase n=1 Tax=Apodospora peruviana TaxID=516989 RepID=A0AAE0MAC7_9PEZI|nr:AAA family ATPase [Apodospora peruviana]